jgi:hypothetical protein
MLDEGDGDPTGLDSEHLPISDVYLCNIFIIEFEFARRLECHSMNEELLVFVYYLAIQ